MQSSESKASNVTAANYQEKSRLYSELQNVKTGGKLYGQHITIQHHPRQWGAWRAYFKLKGLPTAFMDARAKQDRQAQLSTQLGFSVPAPWPADFDSDRSSEEDHYAANAFLARLEKVQAEEAQPKRRVDARLKKG